MNATTRDARPGCPDGGRVMRSAAALLLVLAAACADDAADGAASGSPDERDAADGNQGASGSAATGASGVDADIDDYVRAFCELARSCCGEAGFPAQALANCEADAETQMDLVASVRAGKTVLNQPVFSECLATFERLAQGCGLAQTGDAACSRSFSGLAAEGEACTDVVECARDSSPVMCLVVGEIGSAGGVCHALARSGAGEPCALDADENFYGTTYSTDGEPPPLAYCDRQQGLRCDRANRACEALPSAGEPCEFDCAPGLYCDGSCKPTLDDGAACDARAQCGPGRLCDVTCRVASIADTEICEGDLN